MQHEVALSDFKVFYNAKQCSGPEFLSLFIALMQKSATEAYIIMIVPYN
jgi:hypothetical protein